MSVPPGAVVPGRAFQVEHDVYEDRPGERQGHEALGFGADGFPPWAYGLGHLDHASAADVAFGALGGGGAAHHDPDHRFTPVRLSVAGISGSTPSNSICVLS